MRAFIPCCSSKKPKRPKPTPSNILTDTATHPNTLQNHAQLDTLVSNPPKEKQEIPLALKSITPRLSVPFIDNPVEWKDTEEERKLRQSQGSLFNLTRDYEVQKTPELYIPEQNKKENYLNHELNDSDSMGNSLYQLTKELNTSFSKKDSIKGEALYLKNFKEVEREYEELERNMKDRRFLIEENKEADDKKIQQITRSVGDNRKGHKRDPPNTINDIPNSKRVLPVKPLPSNQYMENLSQCLDLTERQKILAFDEKVLNVGRDSQFGAFSLRTSDRYRGINFHSQQKIPSGLTVNQTSMQKYSQLQKSKMQKSSLPSQTSHVVKNSLRQYLGQSEEGYSMESNIPGRINYDSILNHNLIANQNMILDDSILEAQGVTSKGKMIIAESSKIDEHNFPPWNKAIHEEQKNYQAKNVFEDGTFSYDLEKIRNLYDPQASIGRIKNCENARLWGEDFRKDLSIFQGKSLTCSLISALLTILNYENIKKVKLIENIIHPQNNKNLQISQSGKYGVKLYLNGTKRLVEIDDQVVFRKQSNSGEMMPLGARTSDLKDFRVALIEKAICKVYSSSDMILHSVPSIECYRLTGWVPEVIKVGDIANSDHLWQRIFQNAEEDNILVSLGTRSFDAKVDKHIVEYQQGHYKDKKTDVILDHAYAILSLAEIDEFKFLKIRNTWGHTPVKSFQLTDYDEDTKKTILDALRISNEELNKDGISVILWEDIIKLCSTVYLNWSPTVYPYRQTIHSRREIPIVLYDPDSKLWREEYSVEYSPQFLLKIPPHDEDFEVRILFERHVDSLKKDNFYSLRYHLFSYKGDRIVYPHEALRSQAWSPREVLSDVFIFEASKEVEIYSLVLLSTPTTKKNKYNIKDQVYNFTFEVFSFIEIEIIELPFRKIKQREMIEGRFNEENTGGNILSPNFLLNPKYVLSVKEKADFQFKVEGPNESSLMLVIMPTTGLDLSKEPIARIDFQNLVSNNPGFYFEGFSHYKLTLHPDNYIILISNQNIKYGSFRLYIDTLSSQISYSKTDFEQSNQTNIFTVTEYQEPPTLMKLEIEGEWTETNSKGISRLQTQEYQSFMKNPGYILPILKTTTLRFRLQSPDYIKQYNETLENGLENALSLEPPSMSIAVFQLLDNFKFKSILSDENYVPAAWGFYSRELILTPGQYLVVCSNYEKGFIGKYRLSLFSSEKIKNIQDSADLMKLNHTCSTKGVWSKRTAGGSSSELTFYTNPSYEITASEDCDIYIELTCQEPHPLCLSLFKSNGKRITQFDSEIFNGMNTNTFASQDLTYLRTSLIKGKKYLLVPSTARPSQLGKFEIKIESTEKVELIEKKAVNYKSRIAYSGEWNPLTNMGPKGTQKFLKNPSIRFEVLEVTKFRIHLYTADDTASMALHLYEIDEENNFALVKDSGLYTNVRMGVFMEDEIKPNKNGYLIIASTSDNGRYVEFFAELSCLKPNHIEVIQLINFNSESDSF